MWIITRKRIDHRNPVPVCRPMDVLLRIISTPDPLCPFCAFPVGLLGKWMLAWGTTALYFVVGLQPRHSWGLEVGISCDEVGGLKLSVGCQLDMGQIIVISCDF